LRPPVTFALDEKKPAQLQEEPSSAVFQTHQPILHAESDPDRYTQSEPRVNDNTSLGAAGFQARLGEVVDSLNSEYN
jgi:hypothetical protein